MNDDTETQRQTPIANEASSAAASHIKPGMIIDDRYEVVGLLGRGGMGEVYRVHHLHWGVDLALKTIRGAVAGPEDIRAIEREARAWIELGVHPHIAQCLFVRTLLGLPRLFIEFVEGSSLAQAPPPKPTSPAEWARFLSLAIQVCGGLSYAHERGLVHQDVKPSNILVTRADQRVCITDFGLARWTDEREGIRGGTPAYAAPEQWEDEPVDAKADIYALGVVLYEIVAGHRPFQGSNEHLREQHRSAVPAELSQLNPHTPESLSELVATCLAKRPSERPADMSTVRSQLAAIYSKVTGEPPSLAPMEPAVMRADTLNNRAVSQIELGLVDDALASLKDALRVDGRHPEANYNEAVLRWERGEASDLAAIQRLEGLATGTPSERVQLLLGKVHLARGAGREALAAFLCALEARESADARVGVGEAYLWLGQPAEAERAFRAVLRTKQNHAAARAGLLHAESREPRAVSLASSEAVEPKILRCYRPASYGIVSSGFTADGRLAVTGDRAGAIRVWDVARLREIHRLGALGGRVDALSITPNGGRLLVGATDSGSLSLWELQERRCIYFHEEHMEFFDVSLSHDGQVGLSGDLSSFDDRMRLWDAQGTSLRTFPLEGDTAVGVALSGDGSRAITGGHNGILCVWDTATGSCIQALLGGHEGKIQTVALHERFAISGGTDGRVCLWDLEKGELKAALSSPHEGIVLRVAVSACGRLAASAGHDGFVQVWDTADCARSLRFIAHEGGTFGVAIHPRQSTVLTAGNDGLVREWDLQRGTPMRTLGSHKGAATSLSLAPEAGLLASGGEDQAVRLWDLDSGRCVWSIEGHDSVVEVLEIGEDKALSADSESVRVWDLGTGQCLLSAHKQEDSSPEEPHPSPAMALQVLDAEGNELLYMEPKPREKAAWSLAHRRAVEVVPNLAGDGGIRFSSGHPKERQQASRLLVSTDYDTKFEFRDRHGATVHSFEFPSYVTSACVSPDTKAALTGLDDGTVALWQLHRAAGGLGGRLALCRFRPTLESTRTTGQAARLHAEVREAFTAGRFAEVHAKVQELRALAGYERDPEAIALLHDLGPHFPRGSLGESWCSAVLDAKSEDVTGVALSMDGRCCVSGHWTGIVIVWDLAGSRLVHRMSGHKDRVTGVAISADGRRGVSTGADGTLRVWDLLHGTQLAVFETKNCQGVALAQCGALAVCVGRDIELLELDCEGRGRTIETGLKYAARGVAVDSAGTRALVVGDEYDQHWDLSKGELIRSVSDDGSFAAALTPDGRFGMTAERSGRATLYDLGTGARGRFVRAAEDDLAFGVALSEDGRVAVTAAGNGSVRVWSMEDHSRRATLDLHSGEVKCVALTPQARRAVSGGADGTLRVWELDWELLTEVPTQQLTSQTPGSQVDSEASPVGPATLIQQTAPLDATTQLLHRLEPAETALAECTEILLEDLGGRIVGNRQVLLAEHGGPFAGSPADLDELAVRLERRLKSQEPLFKELEEAKDDLPDGPGVLLYRFHVFQGLYQAVLAPQAVEVRGRRAIKAYRRALRHATIDEDRGQLHALMGAALEALLRDVEGSRREFGVAVKLLGNKGLGGFAAERLEATRPRPALPTGSPILVAGLSAVAVGVLSSLAGGAPGGPAAIAFVLAFCVAWAVEQLRKPASEKAADARAALRSSPGGSWQSPPAFGSGKRTPKRQGGDVHNPDGWVFAGDVVGHVDERGRVRERDGLIFSGDEIGVVDDDGEVRERDGFVFRGDQVAQVRGKSAFAPDGLIFSGDKLGYVDSEGNVRLKDGWLFGGRIIGKVRDGNPEGALAYYALRFKDLEREFADLKVKAKAYGSDKAQALKDLEEFWRKAENANALGDFAALDRKVRDLRSDLEWELRRQ